MDPSVVNAITKASISLLSPYLLKLGESFSTSAGSAAWAKAGQVYEAIKAKFNSEPSAQTALEDLSRTPKDLGSQNKLHKELEKQLYKDEVFANELVKLLEEADQADVDSVFNTNIHGEVQKFVQVKVNYGSISL